MASFSKECTSQKCLSPGTRALSFESLLKPDIEELTCALEKLHYDDKNRRKFDTPCRRFSESSIEISIVTDSEDDTSVESNYVQGLEGDSGVYDRSCASGDGLHFLEQKIEFLTDVFNEQSKLLATLTREVKLTYQTVDNAVSEHNKVMLDVVKFAILQRFDSLRDETDALLRQGSQAGEDAAAGVNSRARALLDALEAKQRIRENTIDGIVKNALHELLHGDAFNEQLLNVTKESVNRVIKESFTRDLMVKYMPMLQQSHRQLMRQVSRIFENTLKEMEAKALSYATSASISSKQMRDALQSHQHLLEAFDPQQDLIHTANTTIRGILVREFAEWHSKMAEMFSDRKTESHHSSSLEYVPSSPPQPAQPGRSAIDLLMKAAEINEQMKGDVNGSFEMALSASDLSLVMAACRAADPAVVFAPCRLQQPVLLSLLQQLATDMVHDTQLKCRYLEEALINLDTSDATTRTHMPVVIAEMSHNLKSFISMFPSHMSSRRIKMLIMAANSLAKFSEPKFTPNINT